MKLLLINILVMAMFALTHGSSEDPETKYLVINPDKVDYKFTGKKDEHRFGVEIKENKQFHHTRTEEDGVRLGCYGYVHPNGKAYSTHYVADNRGYRIVPHHGDILVYPKDGSAARKASFFESFNEDEIKSSNIRYFFPNGCKSTMIDIKLIDPSVTPSPYVSPIFNGKAEGVPTTVPGVVTNLNENNKNFPTKIIPIVTGTVIQSKLNQNQGDKTNGGVISTTSTVIQSKLNQNQGDKTNGGVISTTSTVIQSKLNQNQGDKTSDSGSDSTGNANVTGTPSPYVSPIFNGKAEGVPTTVPGVVTNLNENNQNQGDKTNGGVISTTSTVIQSKLNQNQGDKTNGGVISTTSTVIQSKLNQNQGDKTSDSGSDSTGNANVTGTVIQSKLNQNQGDKTNASHSNNNGNKSNQHTEPIYSRFTENPSKSNSSSKTGIDNKYLPTNEIEIEEPEKNESLKIVPIIPSTPIISVTPLIIVPADNNNQCQDCCEDTQRPTLLMARNSETTCCKKDVAKLSIPISMDKLTKISMTELIEITSETNTITMLKKLLALAEKYQF